MTSPRAPFSRNQVAVASVLARTARADQIVNVGRKLIPSVRHVACSGPNRKVHKTLCLILYQEVSLDD